MPRAFLFVLSAALFSTACAPAEDPPAADTGEETAGETGAEAISFTVEIENVSDAYSSFGAGSFEAAPIGPGGSAQFTFASHPGAKLSLASMLVESNDRFVAPTSPEGAALFSEDGSPLSGSIIDAFSVWDAGTEADEEFGAGASQPAASEPGTGDADPDSSLRIVDDALPPGVSLADWVDVTVDTVLLEDGHYETTVTLHNLSAAGAVDTSGGPVDFHLSPGVWSLHGGVVPWMDAEAPETSQAGAALEALAEEGDTSMLSAELEASAGVEAHLSPGAWFVADEGTVLFPLGEAAPGGLEDLAEDGNPDPVIAGPVGMAAHSAGKNDYSIVEYAAGALPPGDTYQFTIEAQPGSRLHLVHMFAPSNDWVAASAAEGIALFDADGQAQSATASLRLLDAGTEVDQLRGYGVDQVHLQAEANQGADDPDATVRELEYAIPLADLFEVRVVPN